MGVSGIWQYIGDGEVVPIVHLAAEHFKKHGRPLRIAVDEAGWRFNNLTETQVAIIRKSSKTAAASNPVEKAIFHRIVRLLRQNVELLFVFDGPKRPWKRGRRGGNGVNWPRIRLLQEMLRRLQVPYHMAPGEAEAECAQLQQEGVVDAVWSDDSDALMFGCDFLIRSHYEKSTVAASKSHAHVKIIRAADIRRRPRLENMNNDGFVLFALLAGGDYDIAGVQGCGPGKALSAVQKGFAQRLAQMEPGENSLRLQLWRDELAGVLKVPVPISFPHVRAWSYYRNPSVSTELQAYDRIEEKLIRTKLVDEYALRGFLKESFNLDLKAYLQHVMPIFLVIYLRQKARTTSNSETLAIEVRIPHSISKTPSENRELTILERKIKYRPHAVAMLNSEGPLQTTHWPEDFHTITEEASIPICVLEHGALAALQLAEEKQAAKATKAASKKRPNPDQDDGIELTLPKRSRPSKLENNVNAASGDNSQKKGISRKPQKNGIPVPTHATIPPSAAPLGEIVAIQHLMEHTSTSQRTPMIDIAASPQRVPKALFRLPKPLNMPLLIHQDVCGSGKSNRSHQ